MPNESKRTLKQLDESIRQSKLLFSKMELQIEELKAQIQENKKAQPPAKKSERKNWIMWDMSALYGAFTP